MSALVACALTLIGLVFWALIDLPTPGTGPFVVFVLLMFLAMWIGAGELAARGKQ